MHNTFLGRQADYVLEALTAPADYYTTLFHHKVAQKAK